MKNAFWWLAAPFAIVSALALFSRRKIPRDPNAEKEMTDAQVALAYDEMNRSRLFGLMRLIIIREVKRHPPHGIIIDVGCGPGYVTREVQGQFPGDTLIGVDISRAMLDLAADHGEERHIEYCLGDAEALPFKDNAVDFVLTTGALHHWRDLKKAFSEIQRIMKPGGEILLIDLRRDVPRVLYYVAFLAQRFVMPEGVRQSNGAVGSLRSSYTPRELASLASQFRFGNWKVQAGPAWVTLWAKKGSD